MKESSCFAAVWDRVSGDDWGLMADAVSTQSSGLETRLRRERQECEKERVRERSSLEHLKITKSHDVKTTNYLKSCVAF